MLRNRVSPSALACLLLLLIASPARGRYTLEQVMSSPFPSQLVAAKNGGRLAWVFNKRGVRNVWVADAPEFRARQVTQYTDDDGVEMSSLRITPDGQTVIFARGSETNSAGDVADPTSSVQQPRQEVWAVDVETSRSRLLGEMGCGHEGCEDIQISPEGLFAVWSARQQLWIAPISGATPAHRLTYARGDNAQPKWSPDGKQIAFVSDRGDHSFIGIYSFGRDTVRFLAPSVDRDSFPRWSLDGRQIVFIRAPGLKLKQPLIPITPVPWALWVADVTAGNARKIWQSTTDENGSLPRLTADASLRFVVGNRIVFASEQNGWNHLYSIAVTGGAAVALTPGNFDVKDVTLSADKTSIIYSSNQDDTDRRHIWRVPVTGGKPQPLTMGEGIEWEPLESGDGTYVFCLASGATIPAMPYRITNKGLEIIARETLPSDFPSAELVPPKQVIFDSADGISIHGQLFVPRGRPAAAPAVIFLHGGPIRQMMLGFHPRGYYHYAYAENQYLASLGFVVLSVNYRRGIMYGRAFREAANAGWRGASEYKDVVAAAKYLQSLPIVDPHKIGLWGGSYGGFLTALALARNSDLFAAGVDLHGVHDWPAFLRRPELQAAPDAAEAAKLAFESSPDASIVTWRSPVLLIHGDDDRNVAFNQTVDLVQRLREQHVPFEQLIFPDEIHSFLLWRSWIKAYSATADFFERTLKRGEKIATGEQVDSTRSPDIK